ncbi:unnamed protein product [Heligmosomoides polygyrus]|uniref:G_PROTEIN_RECEP_F1_2 domain-containing protein n=1 Tax=Heligmosomoides polygyrus TaxID=6339 RepID=A0A3P7YHN2_HELPZ|nr:unnamed protein product [Heligmosomoides polygyrus]
MDAGEREKLAHSDVEIKIHPDSVHLEIPEEQIGNTPPTMKKALSMTSIRTRLREQRARLRRNQCAGIVVFLVLGTLCNVLAYLASVWSAQLNADVVKSAVENEHTLRFKLKKTLSEAPSKYLIGLLNFGGRVLSAVGTVMIVQVIASWCKRRRYNVLVKSAAEEADTVLGDAHMGVTDTAGECCLSCFQEFR